MDFGLLPPEVNSGVISAGPGPGRCWHPPRAGTRWPPRPGWPRRPADDRASERHAAGGFQHESMLTAAGERSMSEWRTARVTRPVDDICRTRTRRACRPNDTRISVWRVAATIGVARLPRRYLLARLEQTFNVVRRGGVGETRSPTGLCKERINGNRTVIAQIREAGRLHRSVLRCCRARHRHHSGRHPQYSDGQTGDGTHSNPPRIQGVTVNMVL